MNDDVLVISHYAPCGTPEYIRVPRSATARRRSEDEVRQFHKRAKARAARKKRR